MTDIDKARTWAEIIFTGPANARARATAEIIQSLPDQWVDVEKVREIIADMDLCLKMESTSDFSKGIDNATTSWRDALKALIYQKLPTLADLTEEERKACQWMQADVKLSGEGSVTCVIADPRMPGAKVRLWAPHGGSDDIEAGRVTPLPDLPKLQWPGNEVVEPPALPEGMRLADHETYGRVVVSPKDDLDGDYRVFCSQDQTEYGDNWWYAHKSELTFLDGDQHV